MSETCSKVTPGQPLKPWQQSGLKLVALFQGRDVVLAIDLTESVGLNDEGRIRLRQIVEDSLDKGDTVYVVTFASTVYPQNKPIVFRGKEEDIEEILDAIPFQADLQLRNTDIQRAELSIYQQLAQLNQCRLGDGAKIKPQSVVWLSDAPLATASGNDWIETPFDSPFRDENSTESQERRDWLDSLPLEERSREIITENSEIYKLSVVDLAPTVQEFCTPAPGGKETCLVTPYLIQQLWLPTSTLAIGFIACLLFLKQWLSWQKQWQLVIEYPDTDLGDEQLCRLAVNKRMAIGGDDSDGIDRIDCPGTEVRGYLERKGNQLFIVPIPEAPSIYYNGREISNRQPLSGDRIRINCPELSKRNSDFEIAIVIKK